MILDPTSYEILITKEFFLIPFYQHVSAKKKLVNYIIQIQLIRLNDMYQIIRIVSNKLER